MKMINDTILIILRSKRNPKIKEGTKELYETL